MKDLILIVFILFCMVFPILYWFTNPELSIMQIFLKFWWIDVASFILVLFLIKIKEDENSN